MRATHTYAVMEVSEQTFLEIKNKLLAAGYQHAIHGGQDDGTLVVEMHGIALKAEQPEVKIVEPHQSNGACPICHKREKLSYHLNTDKVHCGNCKYIGELGEFRAHERELEPQEPITR